MSLSAEHKSKFAALRRQWWRLHMSEKFSSGTKKPNEKTNKSYIIIVKFAVLKVFYVKILPRSLWTVILQSRGCVWEAYCFDNYVMASASVQKKNPT